jgi:hypothetical protein
VIGNNQVPNMNGVECSKIETDFHIYLVSQRFSKVFHEDSPIFFCVSLCLSLCEPSLNSFNLSQILSQIYRLIPMQYSNRSF